MKRYLWVSVAIFFAVVFGALVGGRLPVLAQGPLLPVLGGGYRVTVETAGTAASGAGSSVPFVVVLTSDGGVIGTVAPLSCLNPGVSIAAAAGSWTIGRDSRGFDMQIQMIGPIYEGGQEIGEMQITATMPFSFNGPIAGSANIATPQGAGCSSLNGAATFTATRIPPIPPAVTSN